MEDSLIFTYKVNKYMIHMSYICYRQIKFDLQIASILLNGSCYSLRRGNVTLSYRIGNSNQWNILEEYASEGKHSFSQSSWPSNKSNG